MMEQHFKQVAESMKWVTQAMVQNDITIKEGENAGPPPTVQIPLNIRQIMNNESESLRLHKMARTPFYTKEEDNGHHHMKIRRYPVPDARVSWKTQYYTYN
jgi:hypothetical protein